MLEYGFGSESEERRGVDLPMEVFRNRDTDAKGGFTRCCFTSWAKGCDVGVKMRF